MFEALNERLTGVFDRITGRGACDMKGGLAAAVRLGARGYRVTVLERLAQPGGRARVHRQDGFTFDAGPTVITDPACLDELWSLSGARIADDVALEPVQPFYRLSWPDGALSCL